MNIQDEKFKLRQRFKFTIMQESENKYKIPYINACIRATAKRLSLHTEQAFAYLKKFLGLDYLIEFYDTLHLQSIDDAVDEMLIICQQNGGRLK